MDKKKLLTICACTGFLGGHYFAIGKYKKGLLYLFTVGLFFFGWLYDLFRIATTDDFLTVVNVKEAELQQIVAEKKELKMQQIQEDKERVESYKKQGTVFCPRCHSTSITAQKRGFKVGRAVVGSALTGGLDVAALAGGIGKDKIIITCLNCGHNWKPGKR